MLKEKIQQLAKKIHPDVIKWRRHLHMHPELSFEEYNTSSFIASILEELNIPYQKVAKTGILALIKGSLPGNKVLALRADIDALPILETNEISYKSTNKGVMHACGHDVHTASLLGCIHILNSLKNEFAGTIKFIFQPGEERLPGGASLMIKEGVLDHPKTNDVIGQHVMPGIETGKVGFRSGQYMASADELYVTVKGKGGHAATPQLNIDPVVITAHIIVALQQIVSRNADPRNPSVLSFGKIIANGATNVIPDRVQIEGTFRALNESWRKEAHKQMKTMAEGIAKSMGGSCDFNIKVGYPCLINHEKLTQQTRLAAEEYLGKEHVIDLDIWMAAEDFAYYSQAANACFYRLGVGNEQAGIISPVHTSTFNIDEKSLEIGSGLMAYLAIKQNNQTI